MDEKRTSKYTYSRESTRFGVKGAFGIAGDFHNIVNIGCSITIADVAHVLRKKLKNNMMKSPEVVFAKRSIGYDVILPLEKVERKTKFPR